MKKLIVDIPADLMKSLKIEAVNRGTTLRAVVIEKIAYNGDYT